MGLTFNTGLLSDAIKASSTLNVGIGTSSPAYKFHVYGGNGNSALIDNSGSQFTTLDFANNGSYKGGLYWDNTNTAFTLYTNISAPILFSPNNTEKARLTAAGSLGLGTNSPVTILNASSPNPVITLTRSDNGTTAAGAINFSATSTVKWQIGTNEAVGSGLEFNTGDQTGNLMYLSRTGSLGLGTTAPVYYSNYTYLHIAGKSTTQGGVVYLTTSDNSIVTEMYVDSNGFTCSNSSSTNPTKFNTNGTEKMRITSGGTVQINNSASYTNYKLVVTSGGTTSATYAFRLEDSATYGLIEFRSDGLIQTGLRTNSPYNLAVAGRPMYIASDGGLGYNTSVRESKTNIKTIESVDWLFQLNPVTFNKYKKDNECNYTTEYYEDVEYGFIADEVEQINTDFVFYDIKEDGTKKLAGVKYESMTAVLTKAIQEQNQTIEQLKDILKRNNLS